MKMLGSAKVTETMYNYARSNIASAFSSMHLSGKLFPALPFIVIIYMKIQKLTLHDVHSLYVHIR